jgi:hypothetical protein
MKAAHQWRPTIGRSCGQAIIFLDHRYRVHFVMTEKYGDFLECRGMLIIAGRTGCRNEML